MASAIFYTAAVAALFSIAALVADTLEAITRKE